MANREESSSEKPNWKNRERVLVFCSRGTGFRDRHLMLDFRTLLPHSKGESKMNKNDKITIVTEICEMRNCNKCMYFESKKKQDLYLWISNIPKGPTAKFLVRNVHTMDELKLTGNCLKGSRPILSFDSNFQKSPHLALLKELFAQTLGTPLNHPRSQPFIDHVFSFSLGDDGQIWFRNYQIVDAKTQQLEEIGPRMVLELITIQDGSFCGPILYKNPAYVSPNMLRSQARNAAAGKYVQRVQAKQSLEGRRRKENVTFKSDATDEIFETEKRPATSTSSNFGVGKEIGKKIGSEIAKETEAAQRLKRQIETKKRRKTKKSNKKRKLNNELNNDDEI